ncbi:histidine kinase [Nibrella saemangeumensis]|uniref:Histidine kinase n=1 Tax=Nibrella saemangeumensis TaxID=1084526 RepID=A0ABP8MUE5_9BACT
MIGIPAVELLTNLLYLEQYQYNWWVYLRTSFWGVFYIFLLWEAFTRWLRWVRAKYPNIEQTRHRILLTFAGYFAIITAAQITVVSLFGLLGIAGVPITWEVYLHQLLGGYVVILIVGILYEIIYYLSKLKTALIEAETAKKISLQHQYDSLKAQVNPHFLFNSLTSLSMLIDENPRQASAFIDEMSTVYRYLLQTSVRDLIPLRQELNFLDSYYHLLKIRYGNSVFVVQDVRESLLENQLPPLSLQLLIENALKHNMLLPECPLTIRVACTPQGELEVTNTICRKTTKVIANRTGLATIVSRYRLLDLPDPVIEDDGKLFSVRLPLLRVSQEKTIQLTTP